MNNDAEGTRFVAVGMVPFVMLPPIMPLATRDGQGVPSGTGSLVRVTVTSGAGPVGHEVPQTASTVVVTFYSEQSPNSKKRNLTSCACTAVRAARPSVAKKRRILAEFDRMLKR